LGNKRVLTKDDWLRAAMEVLRTQGVGGVRVLKLAGSLGVTRGSFYWHFRDRQDLLDHMVDWWDREMTDTVITHIGMVRGGAYRRVLALGELVLKRDLNRYDIAMRSWAKGDPEVAPVVERVLKKRVAYVSSLLLQAGFSPAEARNRGHLLAIYIMSEGEVFMGESLEARLRLLRRQVRSLTRHE
jgi:AcrR family transcriptional regulator